MGLDDRRGDLSERRRLPVDGRLVGDQGVGHVRIVNSSELTDGGVDRLPRCVRQQRTTPNCDRSVAQSRQRFEAASVQYFGEFELFTPRGEILQR